jgi:hypothetical protein
VAIPAQRVFKKSSKTSILLPEMLTEGVISSATRSLLRNFVGVSSGTATSDMGYLQMVLEMPAVPRRRIMPASWKCILTVLRRCNVMSSVMKFESLDKIK